MYHIYLFVENLQLLFYCQVWVCLKCYNRVDTIKWNYIIGMCWRYSISLRVSEFQNILDELASWTFSGGVFENAGSGIDFIVVGRSARPVVLNQLKNSIQIDK